MQRKHASGFIQLYIDGSFQEELLSKRQIPQLPRDFLPVKREKPNESIRDRDKTTETSTILRLAVIPSDGGTISTLSPIHL
jgi:hypothetical protein